MIATAGLALVALALGLDAWLCPPLPQVNIPVLGVVALLMMQLAKRIRESEGEVIPQSVLKDFAADANLEALLSTICGLSVVAVLVIEEMKAPKQYQQVVTLAALALFALTAVAFGFTRKRFEALMEAAS